MHKLYITYVHTIHVFQDGKHSASQTYIYGTGFNATLHLANIFPLTYVGIGLKYTKQHYTWFTIKPN